MHSEVFVTLARDGRHDYKVMTQHPTNWAAPLLSGGTVKEQLLTLDPAWISHKVWGLSSDVDPARYLIFKLAQLAESFHEEGSTRGCRNHCMFGKYYEGSDADKDRVNCQRRLEARSEIRTRAQIQLDNCGEELTTSMTTCLLCEDNARKQVLETLERTVVPSRKVRLENVLRSLETYYNSVVETILAAIRITLGNTNADAVLSSHFRRTGVIKVVDKVGGSEASRRQLRQKNLEEGNTPDQSAVVIVTTPTDTQLTAQTGSACNGPEFDSKTILTRKKNLEKKLKRLNGLKASAISQFRASVNTLLQNEGRWLPRQPPGSDFDVQSKIFQYRYCTRRLKNDTDFNQKWNKHTARACLYLGTRQGIQTMLTDLFALQNKRTPQRPQPEVVVYKGKGGVEKSAAASGYYEQDTPSLGLKLFSTRLRGILAGKFSLSEYHNLPFARIKGNNMRTTYWLRGLLQFEPIGKKSRANLYQFTTLGRAQPYPILCPKSQVRATLDQHMKPCESLVVKGIKWSDAVAHQRAEAVGGWPKFQAEQSLRGGLKHRGAFFRGWCSDWLQSRLRVTDVEHRLHENKVWILDNRVSVLNGASEGYRRVDGGTASWALQQVPESVRISCMKSLHDIELIVEERKKVYEVCCKAYDDACEAAEKITMRIAKKAARGKARISWMDVKVKYEALLDATNAQFNEQVTKKAIEQYKFAVEYERIIVAMERLPIGILMVILAQEGAQDRQVPWEPEFSPELSGVFKMPDDPQSLDCFGNTFGGMVHPLFGSTMRAIARDEGRISQPEYSDELYEKAVRKVWRSRSLLTYELLLQPERGYKWRIPSINPPQIVQLTSIARGFLDRLLALDGRVTAGKEAEKSVATFMRLGHKGLWRSTDMKGGTDLLEYGILRAGAHRIMSELDIPADSPVGLGLIAGLTPLRCTDDNLRRQERGPLMGIPTSWAWLNMVNLCSWDLSVSDEILGVADSMGRSPPDRIQLIKQLLKEAMDCTDSTVSGCLQSTSLHVEDLDELWTQCPGGKGRKSKERRIVWLDNRTKDKRKGCIDSDAAPAYPAVCRAPKGSLGSKQIIVSKALPRGKRADEMFILSLLNIPEWRRELQDLARSCGDDLLGKCLSENQSRRQTHQLNRFGAEISEPKDYLSDEFAIQLEKPYFRLNEGSGSYMYSPEVVVMQSLWPKRPPQVASETPAPGKRFRRAMMESPHAQDELAVLAWRQLRLKHGLERITQHFQPRDRSLGSNRQLNKVAGGKSVCLSAPHLSSVGLDHKEEVEEIRSLPAKGRAVFQNLSHGRGRRCSQLMHLVYGPEDLPGIGIPERSEVLTKKVKSLKGKPRCIRAQLRQIAACLTTQKWSVINAEENGEPVKVSSTEISVGTPQFIRGVRLWAQLSMLNLDSMQKEVVANKVKVDTWKELELSTSYRSMDKKDGREIVAPEVANQIKDRADALNKDLPLEKRTAALKRIRMTPEDIFVFKSDDIDDVVRSDNFASLNDWLGARCGCSARRGWLYTGQVQGAYLLSIFEKARAEGLFKEDNECIFSSEKGEAAIHHFSSLRKEAEKRKRHKTLAEIAYSKVAVNHTMQPDVDWWRPVIVQWARFLQTTKGSKVPYSYKTANGKVGSKAKTTDNSTRSQDAVKSIFSRIRIPDRGVFHWNKVGLAGPMVNSRAQLADLSWFTAMVKRDESRE